MKEKLFFYAAYSPRFTRRENTYILDDGRDTFRNERTDHQLFTKLNWDPMQRVRTTFTWLWTPTKSLGRIPAYDYYGNGLTGDIASAAPNKGVDTSSRNRAIPARWILLRPRLAGDDSRRAVLGQLQNHGDSR